jgi:hypothetical protein
MRFLAVLTAALAAFTLHATEHVVPAGADVGRWFAQLPADASLVRFSAAAEYRSNGDIVLPPDRMLVIDGAGCRLLLGPESRGFTSPVADQKEAASRVARRYVIRDFAEVQGGRKAIDLQATLGSEVRNVKLVRQTEVAVDLRFCLMARLEHVFVTNPGGKGIVLRQGDWPGATGFNSQSNSTVLEQCRVYASKTTTNAFEVRNSGGVRMTDCVSEGAPVDHDLFLSATVDGNEEEPAGNTVVKSFTLANFHVEHAARIASIHVNMPSKCSVSLTNVYWNGAQPAPVIRYVMGQLNLSDIGWWNDGFRIITRISAPRINVERCHSGLDVGDPKAKSDTRAGVLELRDPLPNNTQLKLSYVRVRDKAM